MKRTDSLRHSEGAGRIVRLLDTTWLDSRWFEPKSDGSEKRQYLVVTYDADADRFVPAVEGEAFDEKTHAEIQRNHERNEDEDCMKDGQTCLECVENAREDFREVEKERYWTDDWEDAQKVYVEWCEEQCKIPDRSRWLPTNKNLDDVGYDVPL